jgi:hypothetical protein
MELLSKGETNQSEIARILQVDKSIICQRPSQVPSIHNQFQYLRDSLGPCHALATIGFHLGYER